ncbi:IclR family transcriptional regulator C-terminal domain-containing protein [Streptomyces sp. NPDC001536]|uniref:IclR family transcriptional regulator domain-containing protein n=1 Tax=Streptomyces sp. NPDC001536 TaxID=3364583 RepID=UPI00369B8C7C
MADTHGADRPGILRPQPRSHVPRHGTGPDFIDALARRLADRRVVLRGSAGWIGHHLCGPGGQPGPDERDAALREVRARGWALTDQQLAPGIRSVAAPSRDGSGQVIAALNVHSHAGRDIGQRLVEEQPPLLQTAGDISADFTRVAAAPQT